MALIIKKRIKKAIDIKTSLIVRFMKNNKFRL